MVLTRFLPQNEKFYEHFQDAASNALAVARLLNDIITSGQDLERKVHHLHDLEHRGDDFTHRVYSALNSTFVTPMDREDIAGLASELDEFVDMMDEAGVRLWLYKLGDMRDPARLFASILVEQAGIIAAAMGSLEDISKQGSTLRNHALELHRLENEGDDGLHAALASLYEGVTEVPQLIDAIRWGEIYGLLEDATDRAEDIGDRLDAIASKYA